MVELGASKVIIQEDDPPVRIVASAATAVAGMVGVTERGPFGQAVRVGSWEEYARTFGGFVPGADLPHAVLGFFQNGGRVLHVVRTAHYQDPDDDATLRATTATAALVAAATEGPARILSTVPAPFVLTSGAVLEVAIGAAPPTLVRFEGSPARLRTTTLGPFLLADGMTLEVSVDGDPAQTLTFRAADFGTINQATSSELVTVLRRDLVGITATIVPTDEVELTALSAGRGSSIQILGGTAVAALLLAADRADGTGTVDRLDAVAVADVDALLAAAGIAARAQTAGSALALETIATGPAARLQVQGTAALALGLDTTAHLGSSTPGATVLEVRGKDPGLYANRLTAVTRAGAGTSFDLLILEGLRTRETFLSLSMDPTDERHALRVVNDPRTGSGLVALAPGAGPTTTRPTDQSVPLTGGGDGLVGLSDLDFLGSPVAHTGLRALDAIADLALVCVPGRASPAIHEGLLLYCEQLRRGTVFALLDPPAGATADDIVGFVGAGLEGRSEYGAIYWPRLRVVNPSPRALGPAAEVIVPASGHLAGICARTDGASAGGVYQAPAGVDVGRVLGVLGTETNQVHDENARDLVFPHRVNPIRGRYVDGARTLRGTGNFPSVPERRGAIFIERSLALGLDRVRHRNNTPELRAEVYRAVFQFLLAQMNVGAFASRDPKTAFFVDVSEALNPPSQVLDGVLRLRIGIATARPAEFVVIEVSQDTRALDAERANAEG